MEPNGDMNPQAPTAMAALMARIQELSTKQMQLATPDPQLDDDLELAKFMAGLVMNYLYAHDALDLVFVAE